MANFYTQAVCSGIKSSVSVDVQFKCKHDSEEMIQRWKRKLRPRVNSSIPTGSEDVWRRGNPAVWECLDPERSLSRNTPEDSRPVSSTPAVSSHAYSLSRRRRAFNRRWPGSASPRRRPRCVLSASSGSRTPPCGCRASSPGCRR